MRKKPCLWPLVCPVCRNSLTEMSGTLQCDRGHTFDIAREGYVNMLLSGKKMPRFQGDAKPMLRARRRFLEAGYYQILSDRINQILLPQLDRFLDQQPLSIIDAGCGEGYFAGRLQEQLSRSQPTLDFCVFGADIAKEAARLGSRRYSLTRFVVADIKQQLPFADNSTQMLLNVFAPRNVAEFYRLSARRGVLLVVIPGEDHLQELRVQAGLMSIEAHKRQQIVTQFAGHFELADVQRLSFSLNLEPAQLIDLVQMTPNYWHMNEESQQRAASCGLESITASFELILFEKLSAG